MSETIYIVTISSQLSVKDALCKIEKFLATEGNNYSILEYASDNAEDWKKYEGNKLSSFLDCDSDKSKASDCVANFLGVNDNFYGTNSFFESHNTSINRASFGVNGVFEYGGTSSQSSFDPNQH